ncbi:MAG: high-potential iron-sulfur protein [Woeseiaceae bacterium]|nr:high-potential iron-sulfur protein [Woeseiaceae bacterium]
MHRVSESKEVDTASRRSFIKSVGNAAALSAIGITVMDSLSADLQRVSQSDPTAVALKYVHDASTVPASLRPQTDRYCNNCALYVGGKDDEWAGCSIFPGKSVAGKGWCNVWVRKQES